MGIIKGQGSSSDRQASKRAAKKNFEINKNKLGCFKTTSYLCVTKREKRVAAQISRFNLQTFKLKDHDKGTKPNRKHQKRCINC